MKLYGTPKHFKVQERAGDHCPLLPCAKFSWLQSAIAKIHYSQTLTLTVTFAKVSYSQSVSQQRLVLGLGFGSMVWLQWALAIADCNQLYLAHTRARTHTHMGWHCLVWWGLDFACEEQSQNADSNTTLICWFTHTLLIASLSKCHWHCLHSMQTESVMVRPFGCLSQNCPIAANPLMQGPSLQNILRLSYDNAKVTIDLRRSLGLRHILRRTQGWF